MYIKIVKIFQKEISILLLFVKKKKKKLKNLYLEDRIQWNIFLNIMVQKKPLHLKKFLFFFI